MKNLFFLVVIVFSTINYCCADETEFASYKIAFVRALSDSFEDSLKSNPPPIPIDLDLAKQQHTNYIQLLKELL